MVGIRACELWLFGGNSNNGANCGLAYANSNNACERWIKGVKTSQGAARYILRIKFMGESYKLFVNAVDIKNFLDDMERNKVTRVKTVFFDKGSLHYAVDEEKTEIMEVDGRAVTERDGVAVFADNGENVVFN